MNHITIEKAAPADLDEVVALYGALCDHLATLPVNPCGWTRNFYPTRGTAVEWLEKNCLYVLRADSRIAATLALPAEEPEGYEKADWRVDASPDEMLAVHTVATHPDHRGKGYSARLLDFAKAEGRRLGKKALRLDVCDINAPAIRVYERAGFVCVHKLDLFGFPAPYNLYRLYEVAL